MSTLRGKAWRFGICALVAAGLAGVLEGGRRLTPVAVTYVIAVGIDEYNGYAADGHTSYHSLGGAVNDARIIRQLMVNSFKIAEDRTVLLLEKDATRARIEEAFANVAARATIEDTVVFTFSGHDWADAAGNVETSDFGLLSVDAVGNQKPNRAVPPITTLDLKAWFSKIPARNLFLVLDGGGGMATRMVSIPKLVMELSSRHSALSKLNSKNIVAMFNPDEEIELDDEKNGPHGQLTGCLAGALTRTAEEGQSRTGWEIASLATSICSSIHDPLPPINYVASGYNFVVGEPLPMKDGASRGVAPAVAPEPAVPKALSQGHSYALLIATDRYNDGGWPQLQNPVRDANAIANELMTNFGYEKPDVLADATIDQVSAKLSEYLDRKFEDNDLLLISFAGHGTFNERLKTGYLAFRDSKVADPLYHTYISHPELYNIVNKIACKHILLVIDACFGGTFDPQISNKRGQDDLVYAAATKMETLARKSDLTTRLYITSGGKEYVPDGHPGANSPFAAQFLRALRTYGRDSGVLTFHDLTEFVDQVKPNQPRYNAFGDSEPAADFWLIPKKTAGR